MLTLQPLFFLWVGPNVPDFLLVEDTVLYIKLEGYLVKAYRDSSGIWKYDTLKPLNLGVRRLSLCPPYLHVAYFKKVETYIADSLVEDYPLLFRVEGMACRMDTLYLHDGTAIYKKPPNGAPVRIYSAKEGLKQFYLVDTAILILEGNTLLLLGDTLIPLMEFEGLGDIASLSLYGKGYLLMFGNGEIYYYVPGRRKPTAHLLYEGVNTFKLYGDTLVILKGDSLRCYLLNRGKRVKWKRRRR